MRNRSNLHIALDLLALSLCVWIGVACQPAHAYLDPGTGSFIIQVLIAGFLGGVATIKLWWHKFIGLFSKKKNIEEKSEEEEEK